MIGVIKAVRQAIGKKPGDTVRVVVQLDTAPRMVKAPQKLAERLKNNPAAAVFFCCAVVCTSERVCPLDH
ncbi:MAG TPA: hypothetical protein PK843_03335 [bacterium]|nr:hypothetical protein [bacterium]